MRTYYITHCGGEQYSDTPNEAKTVTMRLSRPAVAGLIAVPMCELGDDYDDLIRVSCRRELGIMLDINPDKYPVRCITEVDPDSTHIPESTKRYVVVLSPGLGWYAYEFEDLDFLKGVKIACDLLRMEYDEVIRRIYDNGNDVTYQHTT
jgi:hypothetical protein